MKVYCFFIVSQEDQINDRERTRVNIIAGQYNGFLGMLPSNKPGIWYHKLGTIYRTKEDAINASIGISKRGYNVSDIYSIER